MAAMKVARHCSRKENLLGVLNQLGLSLLEDALPSCGLGRAARSSSEAHECMRGGLVDTVSVSMRFHGRGKRMYFIAHQHGTKICARDMNSMSMRLRRVGESKATRERRGH